MFLPFCLFFLNFEVNLTNTALFVAIGITEFFGVYIYMKMHSSADLSISTIVSQLRIIWVPVIAFTFLAERLTTSEYIGILLILAGQMIVALRGKIYMDRGVKFALISSVFVSVNSVLAKRAAPVFETPIIVLAMGLPSVIGFPLLMKNGMIRIKNLGKSTWKKILLATSFNAVTMLFLVKALKYGDVSRVIGLFQSIAVLGVVLGIFLLNEKEDVKRKIIGGMIVLLGVLLLI